MSIDFGLKEESYKHIYTFSRMTNTNIPETKREITKSKHISVHCAKNDMAAFQILLFADEAVSVTLGNEPYFSAQDIRENLRVSIEFPFDINMKHIGAVVDDDTLKKSDILLNDATIEIKANDAACIWVEANTDETTAAGVYHGTISLYHHRMFEAEKLIGELTFDINVYDVAIPRRGKGKFYLDLWQHNSNIARKHEIALYSDKHFDILDGYVRSLAELGQSAITVIASEIPWSSQRSFRVPEDKADMYEYSMIKVAKRADGKFVCDYSIMQRYINLCFKHGIDKEIEVFGLCNIWTCCDDDEYSRKPDGYPEAIRIRYFDEADGTYKYMATAEEITEYISMLARYFDEKGYNDIVRIVADEPADMQIYHKSISAVQSCAKNLKFKTAVNHREFIEEFKDKVSDFVPGLFCISSNHELLRKMSEERTHRLLWYVCCIPQIPNTFVCSHLLEARSIAYLTKFIGFDGFLRWAYTEWPANPRADIRYRYPEWRCGDTNFVYPSYGGEVLYSIRHRALLRGILDYELMCMVEEKGGSELVKAALDTLIKINDMSEFGSTVEEINKKEASELVSLDFDEYDSVRRSMLEFLSK